MKRALPFFVAAFLFAAFAWGGAIKTWSSNDTLTSADLNANFQHIHNLMVGGHGARLVDADVSASAAIAQSKISGLNHMAAKAWTNLPTTNSCNIGSYSTNCGTLYGSGVTSIIQTAIGTYSVTLSYTPTDIHYAVIATVVEVGGAQGRVCTVDDLNTSAPQFTLRCFDLATPGAAVAPGLNILVLDDN